MLRNEFLKSRRAGKSKVKDKRQKSLDERR
jgi:hypothetical protein